MTCANLKRTASKLLKAPIHFELRVRYKASILFMVTTLRLITPEVSSNTGTIENFFNKSVHPNSGFQHF